ncbi:hypothetical protein LY76DRAFT_232558 [Colletotrichum caudatum]|nr:hypothetical protein LY76DRAFT_232558 [Colletotrichum caudatum]
MPILAGGQSPVPGTPMVVCGRATVPNLLLRGLVSAEMIELPAANSASRPTGCGEFVSARWEGRYPFSERGKTCGGGFCLFASLVGCGSKIDSDKAIIKKTSSWAQGSPSLSPPYHLLATGWRKVEEGLRTHPILASGPSHRDTPTPERKEKKTLVQSSYL